MVTEQGDHRAAVIHAFCAGDELALAEIYDRWSPLVYSIALYSLGSVAEAEAVTQQVFTTAWTARHTLGTTDARLSPWLLEIARQAITEAHAVGSNQTGSPTRSTTVTQIDDMTEPADLAERLVLADEVSRLDAVPQQVLRMALYDNLTHAQISESMGLPSGTVRSHLHHGLVRLRTRLEVQADAH